MAVVNVMPETLANAITVDFETANAWAQDNGEWIKEVIDSHKKWLQEAKVEKYQQAYDGYLESVDERDKSRGDDVNHKLQVNLAQLVIDLPVDYMTGNPITWTVEDSELSGKQEEDLTQEEKAKKAFVEEYRKEILKLLRSQDAQRVLSEQLRQGSIGGYSPVVAWVDENGKIDYEEYPINEVIPVYDTRGRLALVLRYYPYEIVNITENGREIVNVTRVEVYDERYVTYYISDEYGNEYTLDEEEVETGNPVEHKAARIPVPIFVNGTAAGYAARKKKNGTSDLGNGVYSLLENYAHGLSDKANTVDRLLDQFLKLKGVSLAADQKSAEAEVMAMRKARAIQLASKDSDAEFIAPQQDDKAVENHLDRVRDTIHTVTFTPKLSDIQGVTATEIKMKYASLDIKAGKKELYFTTAVKQLVEVLTDMLNAKRLTEAGVEDTYAVLSGQQDPPKNVPLYNAEWVMFTLNRNMPQNFLEIARIVATLAGKVPDSYLYELLWFIEDPVTALEEMKKQKQEQADLDTKTGLAAMGLGGEFSSTNVPGTGDNANNTHD